MQRAYDYIHRHEIGDAEAQRVQLEHVNRLSQAVFERQPAPQDGADLLNDESRRALIASLFPEETTTMFDAIAGGAGAGACAVLTQRCWRINHDDGLVVLSHPSRPARQIPVGEAGLSWPDWITGYSLAIIARDQDALNTLGTLESINACARPVDVIDEFWLYYCGAFALAVSDPAGIGSWIDDALNALERARIAEPALVEYRIRPTLALLRALVGGSAASFNESLYQLLQAHRRYFSQPELKQDWGGLLAFEAMALAALAFERGIKPEVASDYLPQQLITGEFPRTLSRVTYHYPRRSIATASEAQWFLDLEGFPRAGRSHQLVELEGELVAQYEAHGAQGLPHARADFVLEETSQLAYGRESTTPALDAGELLYLAETFSSLETQGNEVEDLRRRRAWLAEAIACVDAVLARIPAGQEVVPPETITSQRGRTYYQAEPGRFRRARIVGYSEGLRRALGRIDAEIECFGQQPEQQDVVAPEAGGSEDEAQTKARLSAEMLCAQVRPILEAIARDRSGEVIRMLKPLAGDYEKVFVGDAIEVARRAYATLWEAPFDMAYPTREQTILLCYLAPAGMLAEDNELSRPFPSGYRSIARSLNPHRVWVRWKYVRPGEKSGLAYDGLVWCDDHWAWFPKPYRVLKETG